MLSHVFISSEGPVGEPVNTDSQKSIVSLTRREIPWSSPEHTGNKLHCMAKLDKNMEII